MAALLRHIKWLRRGGYVVVLALFAWYAHARITTPPAAANSRLAAEQALADEPFVGAITEFRGMVLGRNAGGTVAGWGNPKSLQSYAGKPLSTLRADHAAACKLLDDGVFDAALDRIVRETETRFSREEAERWRLPRKTREDFMKCDDYDAAITWLSLRARIRAVEQSDLNAAMPDLRAALRLAGLADIDLSLSSGWFSNSHMPNVVPLFEVSALATDQRIPPPVAKELIRVLRDELGLSLEQALGRKGMATEFEQLLDRYYTDDGNGNGWLVLSAATDRSWLQYGGPPPPRGRIWNLASGLYYSRQTMRERMSGRFGQHAGLDQRSFLSIVKELQTEESPSFGVDGRRIFDGPLAKLITSTDAQQLMHTMITVSRRRAAVVMLAASAYAAAHGVCPPAVSDLIPEWLPEIPLDAVTNAPMRYSTTEGAFTIETESPPGSQLAEQWWYPVKFPSLRYTIQREPGSP